MARYVVIGGGIAGVCCAQEVARLNATDETVEVLLISAAELLKEVNWFIIAEMSKRTSEVFNLWRSMNTDHAFTISFGH